MATDSEHVLLISDNVWGRHSDEITAIAPLMEVIVYEGEEPVADEIVV